MSMPAYRWAKSWRSELTGPQYAVLLNIADRYNDEKGCAYPSYSTIASDTCFSRRTVIRAVAVLASSGLLEVSAGYDKRGHRTSNRFRLPFYGGPDEPAGDAASTSERR